MSPSLAPHLPRPCRFQPPVLRGAAALLALAVLVGCGGPAEGGVELDARDALAGDPDSDASAPDPADAADSAAPGPDDTAGSVPDDAPLGTDGHGPLAIVPAPPDEPFGPVIPRGYLSGWVSDCEIAGHLIPLHGMDVVDDCAVCHCTTWGGRCARRASCERSVCVFADGTEAALGQTVRVAGCYVCTCDEAGGGCVRDVEPPCPPDRCLVADPGGAIELAGGAQVLVSECHACTCDLDAGTLCTNLCHDACPLRADAEEWIPDQARAPADNGCGSCVCDYGDVFCDPRGCHPGCYGVDQPCE